MTRFDQRREERLASPDALAGYSDVVIEHPETAALIADIQEQNERDLVNALPTWEDLDKAKQNAYWSGYEAGREAERDAIYARIFGSNHFFGTDSES